MTRKTAFLSLLLSFLFTTTIFSGMAEAFNLPDNGQTKCYQGVSPYAEIPCAGTGQDGAYDINPLSYTDNGNGTVTDNNTDLMWQQGENPTTYNWYQATGTYDATYNPTSQDVCGELTTGNYSDWRLPTKMELMSIVDYSIPSPGPTIKTAYFPNTYPYYYWSSTPYAGNPSNVWAVLFYSGSVDGNDNKYNNYYVRCIRGGELDFGNFVENYDGTITDNSTGLMWQQGETSSMTWSAALNYCENLELPSGSGQTDWRLPNNKELESITDDARYNPAIDTTFFPNAYASSYWSSTTFAPGPSNAWYVGFPNGNGFVTNGSKGVDSYVRCVRSGQMLFDYYCDDDSDTSIDSLIDGTCTDSGCEPQGCQITPGDDCNDSDPLEYPNQTWYKDTDNDLYSTGDISVQCSRPADYKVASELTATSGDCNDNNGSIYPGATEIKHDGIDQDCNGYDLTIDINKADYSARNDSLKVEATSNLRQGANLELLGYGSMKWFKNQAIWKITVDGAGGNPDTVTVCGTEGCESAETSETGGGGKGNTEGKGKTCSDGIDNDGDGLTDCNDLDCLSNRSCR